MKLKSGVSYTKSPMVPTRLVAVHTISSRRLQVCSPDAYISLPHVSHFPSDGSTVCLTRIPTHMHRKLDFGFPPLNCVLASSSNFVGGSAVSSIARAEISESSLHLFRSVTHTQSRRQSCWTGLSNTPVSASLAAYAATPADPVHAPSPLTRVSLLTGHPAVPSCP